MLIAVNLMTANLVRVGWFYRTRDSEH